MLCGLEHDQYSSKDAITHSLLFLVMHTNHMKTLNATSTFGNFQWKAQVEVDDNVADILAGLGLLQVMQRSPASAAEKEMAGYEKRPAGFKRDSIPFSEDNADILRAALETTTVDIGDDKAVELGAVIEVSEYVPTEGNVKMTEEREAYARNASKLEAFAKKVGYQGSDLGDGTKDGAPVEFVRAIRAYSRKLLAELGAD